MKVNHILLDEFRQAFTAVEKGYLDSVDDRLAERTSLQYEIPDGMTSYEAYQKFPHLVCT
jgi:TAK1-binding protein 1